MKIALTTIASFIFSYLFNAYAYNSFNPASFPIEAKYLSSFGTLFIFLFVKFIESRVFEDMQEKINELSEYKKEVEELKKKYNIN